MSIFDVFRKKPASDARLIGKWKLRSSEQDLPTSDSTIAEFTDDGRLEYAITGGGKTGIMKMTYRTDGGFIYSDQPSSPREEKTEYSIESDGSLLLVFGGEKSRFDQIK